MSILRRQDLHNRRFHLTFNQGFSFDPAFGRITGLFTSNNSAAIPSANNFPSLVSMSLSLSFFIHPLSMNFDEFFKRSPADLIPNFCLASSMSVPSIVRNEVMTYSLKRWLSDNNSCSKGT